MILLRYLNNSIKISALICAFIVIYGLFNMSYNEFSLQNQFMLSNFTYTLAGFLLLSISGFIDLAIMDLHSRKSQTSQSF